MRNSLRKTGATPLRAADKPDLPVSFLTGVVIKSRNTIISKQNELILLLGSRN
jgi:hypothetical protein